MNIEFTSKEAQFLFENIAQLNIPMSNPNGAMIAALGHSVLQKLKAGIESQGLIDRGTAPIADEEDEPAGELYEAAPVADTAESDNVLDLAEFEDKKAAAA